MSRNGYAVERLNGEWVVSASGTRVLTCKRKGTALRTIRSATALLPQSQQQGTSTEAEIMAELFGPGPAEF
jgi:hypothetical protein